MDYLFARRIKSTRRSVIREILKLASSQDIISLAGGLPSPDLFPVAELKEACIKVLENHGREALQYSSTEGYWPLREYIAERYRAKKGIDVTPEEILITNGSQQGVDLLARVFLDEGDQVLVERPGYLGALHAFSLYRPTYQTVTLHEEGVDVQALERILAHNTVKFFYGVPNFQNPSGISYSEENRKQVAAILKGHPTLYVEDDPYGELRFVGKALPSMRHYLGEQAALLGSFSKTVAPAFRLGWVCAETGIMEKLVIAKQACDLHADYFAQRVVYQYLADNDLDSHIAEIREVYKRHRDAMIEMIQKYLPEGIEYTRPEGGMFIWLTLPEGTSSLELLKAAVQKGVSFVPGGPFFADGGGERHFRLSFSYVNEETIEEGIKRLAMAVEELCG